MKITMRVSPQAIALVHCQLRRIERTRWDYGQRPQQQYTQDSNLSA